MRRGMFLAGLLACQLSQSHAADVKTLSFGLPLDINAPKEGGFAIPSYGEREGITRLFRAPDGHLVIAFTYGPLHGIKSDLYDTVTQQRAYPEQELQAANDNSVEENYVRAHHLVMLYPSVRPTPSGKNVYDGYDGGRICPNNPYTIDFQVGPNWDDHFQLFEKLPKPAIVTLDPDCNVSPVTYRYKDRTASFYANDNGFFLKVDRFLMWFDWDAHSDFLNGRDDFVVVPTTALAVPLKRDKTEAYPAAAIARADRIIAQYGARQLKAKKHV